MRLSKAIKRKTAIVLLLIMLFTSFNGGLGSFFPSLLKDDLSIVYAATFSDTVLMKVVENSGITGKSAADVNNAAKTAHTGDSAWSSVKVLDVLKLLGDTSNAMDYNRNQMNAGYTLGQLMVDYARAEYTGAALLTDEEIISIFDMQASAENTANIDLQNLMNSISSAAANAGTGGFAARDSSSMLDTSKFITYREYIVSRTNGRQGPIPTGTLFIGTWLMDSQSITSAFYEMAITSMTQANQTNKLYKSELSSGYWKNISGADSLESILPLSDNVAETDMMDLYISVIVDRDGIPYSAKTGEVVDVFSIFSPYELEEIPELKPLKALYDAKVVSSSDGGSKNYTYWQLRKFFQYDQNYKRDPKYKVACDYVLDVSKRGNIAFYAEDARMSRRFEESGKGFLNSLEIDAETYGDGWLHYNWNGHPGYFIWGKNYYRSKLIRGSVSWAGERAWQREINAFPSGLDTVNERFMNFKTVWLHNTQIHDDISDDADSKMAALTNLYLSLCRSSNSEDKELAEEAINVENKLDSLRRYRAYYNLVENPDNNYMVGPALGFLYEVVTQGKSSIGVDYKIVWYTNEDFTPVDSIVSAVEDAIVECTQAMYRYEGNAIQEGNTVIAQTQYNLQMDVINRAPAGPGAVRESLRQLIDLDNISKHVIAHKSRELNMIVGSLLPTADAKYQQYLHGGLSDDYREAINDPASTNELKNELLKDQKAGVTSVASELQLLIKARAMRLTTDKAIDFIKQRINWAEAQRRGITNDAFQKYATEALDEHIAWLTDLLNQIKAGSKLGDDQGNFTAQIGDLENDILTALDNGDLEGAERLDKQLSSLREQQDAEERRKRSIINDPLASAADKADATDLDTPTGVADKIATEALEKISDGDYNGLEDDIDALEAFDSPRLPEILDALNAHDAPKKLINKTRTAINNGDGDFSDRFGKPATGETDTGVTGGTGDSGSGTTDSTGAGGRSAFEGAENGVGGDAITGNGTGLSEEAMDAAIKDAFGKEFSKLSSGDKAAALTGLLNYAKARDDGEAYDYLMALLQSLLDEHNIFIYKQYLKDDTQEYVSLAAVNKCRRYTRFRMVEKDEDITMSQIVGQTASYMFKVGKTDVVKNTGESELMHTSVVSQVDSYLYGDTVNPYPYISEDSSGKYLYCTCVYVPGTQWAILITPQTDKKIAQFLDVLDDYVEGVAKNN